MDQNSDQLSIDTPELVAIEMPLAGIGSRFIALLVDTLIWVAAILLLALASWLLVPGITAFSAAFCAVGGRHLRTCSFSAELGLLHLV